MTDSSPHVKGTYCIRYLVQLKSGALRCSTQFWIYIGEIAPGAISPMGATLRMIAVTSKSLANTVVGGVDSNVTASTL